MSTFYFCLHSFQVPPVISKCCLLSRFCALNANLCLLMESPLLRARWDTSVRGTCSISPDKKTLRASSQSDPLWLNLLDYFFFFFSPCFPQELLPLILNCLASPVFTLCCFHYANTKPVAGLMLFPPFKMGNGIEEAHLPSPCWYLWEIVFLEISSITHGQDNSPALQKTI